MTNEPSDTQVLVRPEVSAFLDEVRAHLHDLDADDRDELLGGLEADLSDQVADGVSLGDPVAYAAELRAAAGLPVRPRRGIVGDLPRSAGGVLDAARGWLLGVVERPGLRPAWDVVVAVRPAWWVARAWVGVTALDIATGPWEEMTLLPSLGVPGLGEAALVAAVVLSVLIGTGRLWPGSGPDRATPSRLALLAVNALALLAPLAWGLPHPTYLGYGFDYYSYDAGYSDGQRADQGLRLDGAPVRNVFAYDDRGRPLHGVQLVDQDGNPLAVGAGWSARGRGEDRSVGCPAFNGRTPVYNVFPLAETHLRRGTCRTAADAAGAEFPAHPLASLPPVTARPGDLAPAESARVEPRRH